jgi:DNA polymerase-2
MKMETQLGYILTSHWRDTANGLELNYYLKSLSGPVKLTFTNQKIVFFILSEAQFNPPHIKFERKSGGLKNFSHQPVDTVYLTKYKDLVAIRDFCKMKSLRTFE